MYYRTINSSPEIKEISFYPVYIYSPQKIFEDIQNFPAPEYQKESIRNLTISKVFEERIYEKFQV